MAGAFFRQLHSPHTNSPGSLFLVLNLILLLYLPCSGLSLLPCSPSLFFLFLVLPLLLSVLDPCLTPLLMDLPILAFPSHFSMLSKIPAVHPEADNWYSFVKTTPTPPQPFGQSRRLSIKSSPRVRKLAPSPLRLFTYGTC